MSILLFSSKSRRLFSYSFCITVLCMLKKKKKRLNGSLIWSIFFSCHLPIWWPQCTSIWADWAILCWCAWISEWEWAECSFYSLQSWQGKELIPVMKPWLFTRENVIRAKNSFDMKLITALLHVESLWLSGSVSIWVQNRKLKVWLLTRTQNFFIVQCLWQDKRILPLILSILFGENLSELGIRKSKVELRKWSGEGIILFSDIVWLDNYTTVRSLLHLK